MFANSTRAEGGGGKAQCMAADSGEVQRDTCGRQGDLLAVKASGTGLVVGSRCSCKQLLAIVFESAIGEREGRGKFGGRAYE